jgi:hypothetical protein
MLRNDAKHLGERIGCEAIARLERGAESGDRGR